MKRGAVEQIGHGRAARLRRDEVLALAAREDLAQFVETWRNGSEVKAGKQSAGKIKTHRRAGKLRRCA